MRAPLGPSPSPQCSRRLAPVLPGGSATIARSAVAAGGMCEHGQERSWCKECRGDGICERQQLLQHVKHAQQALQALQQEQQQALQQALHDDDDDDGVEVESDGVEVESEPEPIP